MKLDILDDEVSPLGWEEFFPNLEALIESDKKNKKTDDITCTKCGCTFTLNNEEKHRWWVTYMKCPSCNIKYCCLDKTETDLRLFQDEYYLNDRDTKFLEKMYHILVPYSRSMIIKKTVQMDNEDLNYYAHTTAWYLLERYYNERVFYISSSFGAALGWKIVQSLYSKSEKPLYSDHMSLDYEYTDNGKDMYNIVSYNNGIDPERYYEKQEDLTILKNSLMKIIDKVDEYSTSKLENLMRLIAIRNFLRHGQKNVDKLFSKYGRDGKILYDMTLEILKSELSNHQL